ncbi:MAG: chemotaxis protein CheA [Armatimonadota bacterium]
MEASEYKELFISESNEILSRLNKLLIDLEKAPDNKEVLYEIFRQAHTIKGMAGSMGYDNIVLLAHSVESVLELFKTGALYPDKGIVSLLFESFDLLEELIENVSITDEKERNIDAKDKKHKERISSAKGALEDYTKNMCERVSGGETSFSADSLFNLTDKNREDIVKAAKKGIFTYSVTVTLIRGCQMPQVRIFMALKKIKEVGSILNEKSVENQVKTGGFGRHFGFFLMSGSDTEKIKKMTEEIPEIEKVEIGPLDIDKITTIREEVSDSDTSEKKQFEARTVRVPVERLDSLMNLVGELIINKIRLMRINKFLQDKSLNESLSQLDRLSNELQDEMTNIRLVPIGYIFDRFPRMVRDLSQEEGKDISFKIEGAEIGLDRTILDEINDPLIHLLRNAVNHGIEPPNERITRGKSAAGHVKLVAKKEGNFILIELSDDGAGINIDKVKEKAVKMNIITEDEAKAMDDQEAIMLITSAGFSTAEEVTETSGRGVGMSTVKTKVEAFGGSLNIYTEQGKGTKFILKLPVSVAIQQSILIRVANEVYVVPLRNISEVIDIDGETVKTMEHHEVISYRDEVLPLVRLDEKFGFAPPRTKEALERKGRMPVVVVESGHKKAGLIVEEFVGKQEVVIKILEGELKSMKGVAGATILGDGTVALIIDVPTIL